jgi:hypothetical protein
MRHRQPALGLRGGHTGVVGHRKDPLERRGAQALQGQQSAGLSTKMNYTMANLFAAIETARFS